MRLGRLRACLLVGAVLPVAPGCATTAWLGLGIPREVGYEASRPGWEIGVVWLVLTPIPLAWDLVTWPIQVAMGVQPFDQAGDRRSPREPGAEPNGEWARDYLRRHPG